MLKDQFTMVSLQEICCVCMEKNHHLNSVGDKDLWDVTHVHKLKNCVPSQEWFADFKICLNCSNSLHDAYIFIQECIEHQEQRKELMKDRVKNEIHETEIHETKIKIEKSEKLLTCDLCGKCFKTKATLKVHINKIHINKELEDEKKSDSENGEGFNSDVSNDQDFDIPLSTLKNDNNTQNENVRGNQETIEKEEEVIIKRSKRVRKERLKTKEKLSLKQHRRGRKKIKREIKEELPPKKRKPKLPVTCDYCQRVFNHRQTYELHVRTNHTFEKPYECDICPAKFVRNQNLMIHKRSHTNERPYICDSCGKDFASSGNLSHHSKIHLNKREYQCDMCDKSFNKSGNLSAHKIVVHSDPVDWKFVCQVCGKKFPVKGGLVLHMQRHVGKKEDVCQVCKKEFLNKYELKRHMLSHGNDQTFDCTVCNEKTFKTKYGLRRHLAFTHDVGKVKYWKAEKKYPCHVCTKLFTNNYKLKKHFNTHSNEKTFTNVIHQSTQVTFTPEFPPNLL